MFTRVPRNSLRTRSILPRSAYLPRFQSTTLPPRSQAEYAALYGGLVGGSLVLAGTYAWYHLSGTRAVVDTARSTISTVQNAKDRLADATPSDPVAALAFLRYMMKTFLPFPGADKVFDELDRAAEKHGDRVVEIVKTTYQEVHEALTAEDDADARGKIFNALQKSVQEIQKLSFDAASDVFGPILEKSPELKRVLGTSYAHFKSTADKHGPEAQRIASDTYSRLASLFSEGVNSSTIQDATALLRNKSQEISQLASKTTEDSWEAARNSAQPMLERLPDLKKILDENVENITAYVGEERINTIKDLYSRLEALSKSGKPANEIRADAEQIVREKVEELRKQGGAAAKGALDEFNLRSVLENSGGLDKLKSITGLPGLVDQIPRLKELQGIADKRGPEAKKLLDETYSEIKKVLDAKLEEAKKLGEDTKIDTKTGGNSKKKN